MDYTPKRPKTQTTLAAMTSSSTTHHIRIDLGAVIDTLPHNLTSADRVELILSMPDTRDRTIALTYAQVVAIATAKGNHPDQDRY